MLHGQIQLHGLRILDKEIEFCPTVRVSHVIGEKIKDKKKKKKKKIVLKIHILTEER